MKTIGKLSVFMLVISICFMGCEKWGGRIDSLDSDRPTDVGPEFGKRGNGGSTDLGTLYGDLLFILRNDNGTPLYNSHGFVQPLAYVNEVPYLDETGEQYVCAVNDEGEVIPNSYIDLEGNMQQELGVGPMEVEFGRTSIFRAPQRVLDQAILEALKGLSAIDANTLQLDFCGRLFGLIPTDIDGVFTEKTVDSPRENMALYQSLIENEGLGGIINICNEQQYFALANALNDFNWWDVAAGCFAAANDKTGTVCVDKIEYVHSFKNLIGLNPIPDELGKHYFNFGPFGEYDRSRWHNVKLGFLAWGGQYSATPIKEFTVFEVFESVIGNFDYGEQPQFTYNSNHDWFKTTNVGGFAQFADDCNQVLEYVHGDSNIIWVK